MARKIMISGESPDVSLKILFVASLFEGYFSIDWIIDLAEEKPSCVLLVLEQNVEIGALTKIELGRYAFSNNKYKEKAQDHIGEKEKSEWHKKIVELLIRELPEDEQKIEFVCDHMLYLKMTLKVAGGS